MRIVYTATDQYSLPSSDTEYSNETELPSKEVWICSLVTVMVIIGCVPDHWYSLSATLHLQTPNILIFYCVPSVVSVDLFGACCGTSMHSVGQGW
jgi:hypothetical protein